MLCSNQSRRFFFFSSSLLRVGGFTLSDNLDKPWSRVSSLFPPGVCLHLVSRIGFSIPTARRFSSNVTTHALALSATQFSCKKSPYEHALGETRTQEIDLSRHADHLPRRRGCRLCVALSSYWVRQAGHTQYIKERYIGIHKGEQIGYTKNKTRDCSNNSTP